MSAPSVHDTVASQLREAVLRELRRRDLTDPHRLADALQLAPIKAGGLLRRERWPIEASIDIIERLDLPIAVSVQEREGAGGASLSA